MTLNLDGAAFDYTKENSEKLVKDFMNFVITDVPFFALEAELLYLMDRRGITKFRIPAYMTIDSQNHIFHFEVSTVKENDTLRTYKYLGMDLERHQD